MNNSGSNKNIYKIKDLLRIRDYPSDLFLDEISSSIDDLYGRTILIAGEASSGKTKLVVNLISSFSRKDINCSYVYFGAFPYYIVQWLDECNSNNSVISFNCLSGTNIIDAIQQICESGIKVIVIDDFDQGMNIQNNDIALIFKRICEIIDKHNAILFVTQSQPATKKLTMMSFYADVFTKLNPDKSGGIEIEFTKNYYKMSGSRLRIYRL